MLIPFAGKEVVAIKLAIEFTVEEMVFFRGLESDALHRCIIGRDDPSRSSGELMFEGRSYRSIEVLHLFVGMKSFSIWRIEHHQRGSPTLALPNREGIRTFDFLDADLFEFDILLDTGGFDILGSLLDGIERGIGAVDMMGKIPFVTIVIVDIRP